MKRLTFSRQTLCAVGLVLLFSTLADAQMVRPRKPSEPVVQPSNEPPVRTKPSPELKNLVEAEGIREVKVTPGEQNVEIFFQARSGVTPVVELAKEKPAQGEGGQLEFRNRRAMSKAKSAPPNVDEIVAAGYTASFAELERGARYYYIITLPPADGRSTRQYQGFFTTKPEPFFSVRYRGFICEEKTDGPGSDEIYAVVTVSAGGGFIPYTSVTVHPHVVVDDVESGDVHGDPGRVFHESYAEDILVTVRLMEHDGGNPIEEAQKFMTSVKDALAVLAKKMPELNVDGNLNLQAVVNFFSDAIDSAGSALGTDDDVLGTVSRVITAEEMKNLGSREEGSKDTAQGIPYDFFTEHSGHGGVYKVYFDIIPKER